MKNNKRSAEKNLENLLTPQAATVTKRLARDHRLTIPSILKAAIHRVMEELEDDIANDGWNTSGEVERMAVQDARLAQAGKPLSWNIQVGHVIGSKSFKDLMRAERERAFRRTRREGSQDARAERAERLTVELNEDATGEVLNYANKHQHDPEDVVNGLLFCELKHARAQDKYGDDSESIIEDYIAEARLRSSRAIAA